MRKGVISDNRMINDYMENWKTKHLADTYLEGVRKAIPFANEEIEILLRVIKFFKPDFNSFLDLGCGDGVLGKTLLVNRPQSKGLFIDVSELMIKAAKENCQEYKNQTTYVVQDIGDINWLEKISKKLPIDVVVSGFAIHHQDDDNKKRIYRDIFNRVLKPGGIFLNLEQVKSMTPQIETIFNKFFMDKMRNSKKENITNVSIETIEKEFYKDKKVNILAPVEKQCDWLREIGFLQVDCFLKVFELSIFGEIKPE